MQEKLENMKVKMFKACSKDTMSNKNTQLFWKIKKGFWWFFYVLLFIIEFGNKIKNEVNKILKKLINFLVYLLFMNIVAFSY